MGIVDYRIVVDGDVIGDAQLTHGLSHLHLCPILEGGGKGARTSTRMEEFEAVVPGKISFLMTWCRCDFRRGPGPHHHWRWPSSTSWRRRPTLLASRLKLELNKEPVHDTDIIPVLDGLVVHVRTRNPHEMIESEDLSERPRLRRQRISSQEWEQLEGDA